MMYDVHFLADDVLLMGYKFSLMVCDEQKYQMPVRVEMDGYDRM